MNRSLLKKVIIATAILFLAGTTLYYYYQCCPEVAQQEQGPFYDFDDARDTADILEIFKLDRPWLLSSPDYDPAFMLKYRAPDQNPLYLGKLHIKVLRENNQLVGFTAYYKKTINRGQILFVAVKREFRKKGYGTKLTAYATEQLKKLGVSTVIIYTRLDNFGAQKIYKGLGFVETVRDNEGMYLEKRV